MLNVQSFTFNTLREHTYVIYDETKNCAIIDPGCFASHEQNRLRDFIQQQALKVTHLINTHCHIDHILGNRFVKDTYGVKLTIHPAEQANLQLAPTYAPQYGFMHYQSTEADQFVQEGDTITVGNTVLAVMHLPGHSPGHIALYSQKDAICLVGDVLFKGYVGRTDLPGGNYDQLLESICHKLFLLDDPITLYPGHGPATTLGEEKQNNPFCKL